jgi:lysine decarboxylase
VLLTRPSYYGLARDLGDIVAVCQERGVPLVIDEAHGAHLHFLPGRSDRRPACPPAGEPPAATPQPALVAGADLVVQSSHKTLGSLVGSAMLHVGRASLVDAARVQDALNFLQTTSPSFLLLASLDVMRRWMWKEGRRLFAAAVDEAHTIEKAIDALPGIKVMRPERDRRMAGHQRDPLRLVVNVSGTGWNGYEVERLLRTEFQVEDEMADWFNVVYVLSPQDDAAARTRLIEGLRAVSEAPKPGSGRAHRAAGSRLAAELESAHLLQPPIPPLAMPPRRAGLAKKAVVPLASATGRICAEMVMFYPPGIPLLMPGEMVTKETIDVCCKLLAAGAHPYASDATLETIRVVE